MTNVDIRMTKQIRITNDEGGKVCTLSCRRHIHFAQLHPAAFPR